MSARGWHFIPVADDADARAVRLDVRRSGLFVHPSGSPMPWIEVDLAGRPDVAAVVGR